MDLRAYKRDRKRFEKEIERRHISRLVHFTQLENLLPIFLTRKLLSRDKIENIHKIFSDPDVLSFFNVRDSVRMDNKKDYISLSVEHPNYFMFKKMRQREPRIWCIVELKPKLLFLEDSLFSVYNAAANFSIAEGIGPTYNHFIKLFNENINVSRSLGNKLFTRQGLKDCYPTTDQAEVLVKDEIPLEDVTKIYFENSSAISSAKERVHKLIQKMAKRGPFIDLKIFGANGNLWREERC
jgi:hypothetical protein